MPVAPVMATMRRLRSCAEGKGAAVVAVKAESALEQGLQFARFVHFAQDVGAADEFTVDVQLRDGRPVGIFLDALTHVGAFQHVDGNNVLGTAGLEQLDRLAGEAALRKLRSALHEQHDRVLGNGFLDPGLDFAHDYTFKKFTMSPLYEKASRRVEECAFLTPQNIAKWKIADARPGSSGKRVVARK